MKHRDVEGYFKKGCAEPALKYALIHLCSSDKHSLINPQHFPPVISLYCDTDVMTMSSVSGKLIYFH